MDEGAILYSKFLNGEETALAKLVEMYGDKLMLFINSIVGNLSISEELMEDVFMELIVKKHHFKGNSSFKTYLFQIGRNKALNEIKRNKKIAYLVDTELEDTKRVEEEIIKTEEQKHLHEALAKLSKDYKTVLYLIYFEDMSYEEIEKVMKKNNKQVKNLAYRARLGLKEILQQEGFEYKTSEKGGKIV